MYSVIRFHKTNDTSALTDLGAKVNVQVPGAFHEMDAVADRFSCTVSDSDSWHEHLAALVDFVTRCSGCIEHAVGSGIDVEVDIAIEPEDYHEIVTSFCLDVQALTILTEHGIGFMFSVYR